MHSQRVMLALTQKGVGREDAYAMVQRSAMRAWDEGRELRELLAADPEVAERLDAEALDELFVPRWHIRHRDAVMDRVRTL